MASHPPQLIFRHLTGNHLCAAAETHPWLAWRLLATSFCLDLFDGRSLPLGDPASSTVDICAEDAHIGVSLSDRPILRLLRGIQVLSAILRSLKTGLAVKFPAGTSAVV